MIHYLCWQFELNFDSFTQLSPPWEGDGDEKQEPRKKVFCCLSLIFREFFQDICSRHCAEMNEQRTQEKVLIWVIWKSFFSLLLVLLITIFWPISSHSSLPEKCTQNSNLSSVGVSHSSSSQLRYLVILLKSPTHSTPSRRHKYSSRYDMKHQIPILERME